RNATADVVLSDRREIELIHRNGLRLLKLVNTLLDFSRIEAGRVQAAYEAIDLSAYTMELASTFRSAMERAGLRYVVDTASLPAPAYVDRDMWEKIVLNLISNAFKYTLEGEVTVMLRAATDVSAAARKRVPASAWHWFRSLPNCMAAASPRRAHSAAARASPCRSRSARRICPPSASAPPARRRPPASGRTLSSARRCAGCRAAMPASSRSTKSCSARAQPQARSIPSSCSPTTMLTCATMCAGFSHPATTSRRWPMARQHWRLHGSGDPIWC